MRSSAIGPASDDAFKSPIDASTDELERGAAVSLRRDGRVNLELRVTAESWLASMDGIEWTIVDPPPMSGFASSSRWFGNQPLLTADGVDAARVG